MHKSGRQPRIAFFDIETSPIIAAVWQTYEANTGWVERDTHLMSFAVKWSDQSRVKTYTLPDYPGYRRNPYNDKQLARELWKIMDSADIIVAHNGDAFDIKKAAARFIVHGLPPPADYKSIDTLKIARKNFKFDSNKLDNICRYLGLGRKLPHTGAHLWRSCLAGDMKAWGLMRRYNAQDVSLLQAVYERVKPWAKNHPNLNLYTGRRDCPTCQSSNLAMRGLNYSKSVVRQRFLCRDCGASFSGNIVK